MKKIVTIMLLLVATTSAFAQFEKDTKYVGASLSGFNMSVSDSKKFALGVDANAGYFIEQDIMVVAQAGIHYSNSHFNEFILGAQGRYYLQQNGVYLAGGLKYVHERGNGNDLKLTPEVGYCYYLNHYVSVEPAVYFDASLCDFKHKCEFGVKIGIGLYF